MRGFSLLLRSQIRFRVPCVISFSFSSSPHLLVMFSNYKIANIPFPPGFLAPSATKAVARVVQSEGIQCILGYHVKHNMWWCSTTNSTNYSSFQHTATQLDFRADWMGALHPNSWEGKRWIIVTFLSVVHTCLPLNVAELWLAFLLHIRSCLSQYQLSQRFSWCLCSLLGRYLYVNHPAFFCMVPDNVGAVT
jgi:hypothetical protein